MIYSWKKIVKHGLPLLSVTIFIEIAAGQLLQGNEEVLMLFPIFLISVPVINSVGGNIGSILGARLASGLHVGYISLSLKDKEMHDNLFMSLLLGGVTYIVLAVIIYLVYIVFLSRSSAGGDVGLVDFISIVFLTGVLLVFVVSIVSVFTAFLSYKKGVDPDDMVAPVVTTIGDVMGILFLFLLIQIVLGV
ncbi:MAG: hypothetical protein DRM98_00765 [Thermoplasmata archaeon]|nr:MAG: hypothetical protein FE039_00010 [Thermoplasmata archaeon]RLF34372.1 MAG: hypothetical protein DRM98_00765 [Thermoplasmata archaeon]RLF37536.1 MAG: hypothetical protein DRM99_00065 [Thermoplasmata archaeon]RLF52496.1 MAG: hypothetical protein DRN24_03200 [Thermoplasmata archaeon]